MLRKAVWLLVVSLCVVALSTSVLAYDEKLTDEEILSNYEWEIVASWEVDENGNIIENGLVLNDHEGLADGRFELVQRGGTYGITMVRSQTEGHHCHLYYKIDDEVLHDLEPGHAIKITIEFFDEGMLAPMQAQYDSNIPDAPVDGTWAGIVLPYRMNSNQWKTVSGLLREARFKNRQNWGSDFRLWGEFVPYTVRKVTIAVIKE